MKEKEVTDLLKYLTINSNDEQWGIVCTTVGFQVVPPKCHYPVAKHPIRYNFQKDSGRTLNEYQLVYIVKGSGYFCSRSVKMTKVVAGTMIMLFPGEWHSYYPDKTVGWSEFWVGFKGAHIDKRIEKGFFSPNDPLLKIGISQSIIESYYDIIKVAEEEKSGCQQLISSIVLHILGNVYYKHQNIGYIDNPILDKINQAKMLMKQSQSNNISPNDIANKLNLGYSWFRKVFKEYTGISPAQYQLQLKLKHAKELLNNTSMTVSEIAYEVGFDNISQFSTFFKKKEGVTASEFKKFTHFDSLKDN